jgi:hypothetical protein
MGVKGVRCVICGAGPLRKPVIRIEAFYPYGTVSYVPICRNCVRKVKGVSVVVSDNPGIRVTYIPIYK